MININRLWQERFQTFLNLFLQYMRLIGNSGLLFSLLFLLIFGSYYYSLLIQQIPDSFPILLFITLVLTYFLVRTRIRSFLKRADIVFLIVAEEKMKTYFTSVLLYNTVIQAFVVIVVSVAVAPLYEVGKDALAYRYVTLIILFLFIKGWNVCVAWLALKLEHSMFKYTLLRATASFVFVYVCVVGAPAYIIGLVGFIMVAFLFYFYRSTSTHFGIQWERLIDMEEALVLRFYRFANAFTDVPLLQKQMKPRKWLNFISATIRHRHSAAPLYLYTHVFFRTEPYFGIYFRLLLIGVAVISMLPYEYGKVIGFALFLFLSAQQLVTLGKHYVHHEMNTLYPISSEVTTHALQQLFTGLLVMKCFLYSSALVVGGFSLLTAIGLFIGSSSASYIFVRLATRDHREQMYSTK